MMLLVVSLAMAAVQAPAAETSKPVDPDLRMVCKRLSRTGSRMAPKRVCLSAFEWRQTQNRARRDVTAIKERSQMETLPVF